jgi:hypothetical protein
MGAKRTKTNSNIKFLRQMNTDERRYDQEMMPQTANQKLELARKVRTMIFIISYLRSSASIRGSLPYYYGIPMR